MSLHHPNCLAARLGGACDCKEIEQHIAARRQRLEQEWHQRLADLNDDSIIERQKAFEKWVIERLGGEKIGGG